MSDIDWCNDEKCFIMNRHKHIEKNIIEFAHINETHDKVVVTAFNIQISDKDEKLWKNPDFI
jgi:hypothetical protein